MSNNDHDSPMLSSPSDVDADAEQQQELFPAADHPSTPQNNHLNASAPGELSPPQSRNASQQTSETQPASDIPTAMTHLLSPGDVAQGSSIPSTETDPSTPSRLLPLPTPSSNNNNNAQAATLPTSSVETNGVPVVAQSTGKGTGTTAAKEVIPKPGAGWKNKKAEEEYQKALEILLDRDFSLREFGELFDDRMGVGRP